MRVLHCIPTFGGGGAERQLAYLAREQAARGLDVHVAFLAGGVNLERLQGTAVSLHPLAARGNHDPRLALAVAALVRRLRPAVVQSWLTQMDVLGGAAARALGVPWVLCERASAPAYTRSAKDRLRAMLARGASAIVSNSLEGDRYWAGLAPRVPRAVVPNGVPFDEIDGVPPPGDDALPAAAPRILFAGRLTAQKDPLGVVDALARLPGAWSALLCGDGPDRARVDSAVARAGLGGRVVVAGFRPDFWRLLKSADVFVSPSRFEGNPNTVLEAMAAGCPLVVSDIPEHREVLDETCAWMVEPGNAPALAEALGEALGDPAAAARRAARARERVRARSVQAAAAAYERVYRAVAAGAWPAHEREEAACAASRA
jgi:glycosyltransferase involved in cell wall biosynthesis